MRCHWRRGGNDFRYLHLAFSRFLPDWPTPLQTETIRILNREAICQPSHFRPLKNVPQKPRQQRDDTSFALKIDATIPARVSAITPLVETVMTAVRQLAKSKELAIETALREALANAIKHGCLR